MATKTPNYKLIKPGEEDFYDVNIPNQNMDTIDRVLKENEEAVNTHLAEDATGAHKASNISFVPSVGMTSTDVQKAVVEAFQLGNSRKSELVDKLLLLDPSLPITYNSTWTEILNVTGTVKTGKRYASGTAVSGGSGLLFEYVADTNTNGQFPVTVTDLPFKPAVIVIRSIPSTITAIRHFSFYDKREPFYSGGVVRIFYTTGTMATNSRAALYKADKGPSVVSENMFTIPFAVANTQVEWEIWGE